MSDHIAKVYDCDISALKSQLAEMGGIAEEQLANAIQALTRRDISLADQVISNDQKLDDLERLIEEKAILTNAKRQPVAQALREIMVVIRVSSDIERIGDLPKNTAKRTHAISEALPRKLSTGLPVWDRWPRRNSIRFSMPMHYVTMNWVLPYGDPTKTSMPSTIRYSANF
jgi:phosphate transport system protein